MPLYELFCLTRPLAANKQALAQIISTAGQTVLGKGGVLTDLTFFGEQQLAYEICNASGKFSRANIWQLQFMVGPSALKDLEHNLKVDERVLRYLVQKQEALPTLPNTHNVQKWASRLTGQLPPPAAAAGASPAQ